MIKNFEKWVIVLDDRFSQCLDCLLIICRCMFLNVLCQPLNLSVRILTTKGSKLERNSICLLLISRSIVRFSLRTVLLISLALKIEINLSLFLVKSPDLISCFFISCSFIFRTKQETHHFVKWRSYLFLFHKSK